jgi:hypothetical protein
MGRSQIVVMMWVPGVGAPVADAGAKPAGVREHVADCDRLLALDAELGEEARDAVVPGRALPASHSRAIATAATGFTALSQSMIASPVIGSPGRASFSDGDVCNHSPRCEIRKVERPGASLARRRCEDRHGARQL